MRIDPAPKRAKKARPPHPERIGDWELPTPRPDRPDDQLPQMPWDIGAVSDDLLMALYTRFTAWANYLDTVVADASNEEEALEDEIEMRINLAIAETGKPQSARALAKVSPEMVELRTKYRQARHYRKLVNGLLDNANRSMAACSRELNRRTGSPAERRAARITP